MTPQMERLAERVRQRQPQVLQVVPVQHALLGLGDALPAPAAVQQLDALGGAGGAGGVHQRGQLVRPDRGGQAGDQVGVGREGLGAARLQLGQREDGYPGGGRAGVTVEQHHVGQAGQILVGHLGQLGQTPAISTRECGRLEVSHQCQH